METGEIGILVLFLMGWFVAFYIKIGNIEVYLKNIERKTK